MKVRFLLFLAFIFIIAFVLPSCLTRSERAVLEKMALFSRHIDGKYDNTFILTDPNDDFSQAGKSLIRLVTKATFKGPSGTLNEKIEAGNGFVVVLPAGFPEGRYVITAAHVSIHSSIEALRGAFGNIFYVSRGEKISEKTYFLYNGKEIELIEIIKDIKTDIALFKIPEGVGSDIHVFPYSFGKSCELKTGNVLCLLGRPFVYQDINLRRGEVSSLSGAKTSDVLVKKYKYEIMDFENSNNGFEYCPENYFMFSAGVNYGDSGTPVIAVRDGQYELVGFTAAKETRDSAERIGWALKIDVILDRIKQHFDK